MAKKQPSPAKPKKTPKPVGRQSLYTPALGALIADRLAKGEPLAQICRDVGMPSDRTVRDWQTKDAEFAAAIACARESGHDMIAADCLRISDTPMEGVETTTKADGSIEVKTGDMLGHRKLQIDTRLKLLAKWNPKRYGDKIETTIAGRLSVARELSDDELISIAASSGK